jgi:hypothetical protein
MLIDLSDEVYKENRGCDTGEHVDSAFHVGIPDPETNPKRSESWLKARAPSSLRGIE